ncbi:MAG: hypothetical protein LM569_01110 [Desulfurococcaceae archaeon]|jgi:hypothetical protein|nr:hypothetical protein [Desulfurococcaceae archaeon]
MRQNTNKLLVTENNENPRALSANKTPLEDLNFIVIKTRKLWSSSLQALELPLIILLSTLVLIETLISEKP